MSYLLTTAACLALLVLIPVWSGHPDQAYPWLAIAALAGLAIAVPLVFRNRDDGQD